MTDSVKVFDRQGRPLTLSAWAAKLADDDYRRVAYWKEAGIIVSTVWLGLEHAFLLDQDFDHPVHIFETMVFGSVLTESQWRYGTEEEALKGHAEAVALVKTMLSLESGVTAAEPEATRSTQGSHPPPETA